MDDAVITNKNSDDVKMRIKTRSAKQRYTKSLSMSFLESNSNSTQRLFVKEFNYPEGSDASSLVTSRNKWITSVNNESLAKRTENSPVTHRKDENNNDELTKNSVNKITSSQKNVNRLLGTFSSKSAFYGGKDELNTISDNAKPILKLWASKSKLNGDKRNSVVEEIIPRKDTTSLLYQGLNNTPWGKYFKPRSKSLLADKVSQRPSSFIVDNSFGISNSNDNSFIKSKERPVSACQLNDSQLKENTKKHNSDTETKHESRLIASDIKKIQVSALKTSVVKNTKENKEHKSLVTSKTKSDSGNFTEEKPIPKYQSGVRSKRFSVSSTEKAEKIEDLNVEKVELQKKENSNNKILNKSRSESLNTEVVNKTLQKENHEKVLEARKNKSLSVPPSKKKEKKLKRSKSDRYVHVNFLDKPRPFNSEKPRRKSIDNSKLLLSNIDSIFYEDVTYKKKKEQERKAFSIFRCKSIENLYVKDLFYDPKERTLVRPRKFSLTACEIDIDSDSNAKEPDKTEQKYTDIEDQIAGISRQRKTSVPLLYTRKNTNDLTNKKNIEFARRNSEPVVTIKTNQKTTFVNTIDDESSTLKESENRTTAFITDTNNNIEMSNRYFKNSFNGTNTTPSSYSDNLQTSFVDKSTLHSRYSFESLNLTDKYNNRSKNSFDQTTGELFSRDRYENRSFNNGYKHNIFDLNRERDYSLNYNKHNNEPSSLSSSSLATAYRTARSISDTSDTTFIPKSSYLRKRLQEQKTDSLYSKHSFSSTNASSEEIRNRLQRSYTTTNDKYDAESVDAFIKAYRNRQSSVEYLQGIRGGGRSSSSYSSISPTEGRTLLNDSEKTYPEDLSDIRARLSQSSSRSSSSSDTKPEGPIRKCRDSDEMESFFKRQGSVKKAENKFNRNEKTRFSDRTLETQSPFIRNLTTRNSERTSKSSTPTQLSNGDEVTASSNTTTSYNTPSIFSSVKKVSSAKISGVNELKSFSSRRRNRLRNNECENQPLEDQETKELPDDYHHDSKDTNKHKSKFSLHKKKNESQKQEITSPTQERRKHSISSILGFRKEKHKDKDGTPPTSPNSISPSTSIDAGKRSSFDSGKCGSFDNSDSPVTPVSKDRRGSGFLKLFQKKSHGIDSGLSKQSSIKETEIEENVEKPIKKRDITVNSKKVETNNIVEPSAIKVKHGTGSIQIRTCSFDNTETNASVNNRGTASDLTSNRKKSLNITVNGIKNENRDGNKGFLVQSGGPDDFIHVDERNDEMEKTIQDILPINKETEVPDTMSNIDSSSEDTNVMNDAVSPQLEKCNKRRDRRNQGLDLTDLNTVINKDKPTGKTKAATLLSPDVNDDLGSSESLYDSDAGNKRGSRNKERIRKKKEARKEAMDRHRSLPAGFGGIEMDFSSAALPTSNSAAASQNGNTTSVNSTTTPKTRKKHKARRANTEFIMNIPSIEVQGASPVLSRDDGIVMRRNNKRNLRKDRPRTLTAGIDSDLIFSQDKDLSDDEESGVIKENMSFANIKKKLLEGLTDDKKVPERIPTKERQKIKRTKSTKRYKTITEGIAPRDLELAKQAMEAEENRQNGSRNVINEDTLKQITAALTSNTDKRKSFIVESRPGSRFQSTEDLRIDSDLKTKDDSSVDTEIPKPALLKRTKSMAAMHLQVEDEDDADAIEIKPLSELKNRFLQAMEDTKQKHLNKKTPIEIKRRNKTRDRKDRPHTICGLDDLTMEKLQSEINNAPENELQKNEEHRKMEEVKKNLLNSSERPNKEEEKTLQEETKKREKKRYQRADSKKVFEELFDDLEDIMNEGLSETDLADALECNPSLHQGGGSNIDLTPAKGLEIVGNTNIEAKTTDVSLTIEPLSDLDFIASQTTQLSSSLAADKRNLRPRRKHKTGSNPVKALQHRDDLIDETEASNKMKEERKSQHPVVEAYKGLKQTAENKQNPVNRLLGKNNLADEAVSALRATVDFSKTKLRKAEVGKKADATVEGFEPTEVTNLLLQVKGRKKVQTTVVEFKAESLNYNDCFIIVTPKDLFCWNGTQSNVIERAKAAEIASRINQKKEMDCKAFEVTYADQGGPLENKVVRTLGSFSSPNFNSSTVSDEDFEQTITSAYMTYTVCEANDPPTLVPLDSQCHRMPTKEILATDSVFVFDFITEVYVWIGRQTNSQQRKIIQKLAGEKFKEGYYQLILGSNSMHGHLHLGKSRRISVTAEASSVRHDKKHGRRASVQQGRHQKREMVARPGHALLLLLYEGSEWVIFREKFCDWPDESRIIRMKEGPSIAKNVSTDIKIAPVDPKTMVNPTFPPKFVIENLDLGRGRGIPKGMDGYHIITLDVKTWHVSENNSILMPDESFGQFHSGEGYVIRWQYRVVKVRALRNCDDVMKAGGMERCCYFFWLGNDCSVNEEGATAVMTLELDREKGSQIRVVLGKEPPALLNLFDGSMIIHAGKRPAPGLRTQFTDTSAIRLYCVRNEEILEACLLQVPAACESLRSRSSFVLLLCNQGEIFLWHGCNANEGTRKTAEHAAQQLIENHPLEAAIAEKTEIGLTEIEEGEEPEVFWIALGGKEDYGSLLHSELDVSKVSPRLFHLECTNDTFISHEIICPSKTDKHNCPFPILQDDLYNIDQPAIFLFDAITHLYLWFGWWPDEEELEVSNSRRRRWGEERRKAMESTIKYAEEVGRPLQNVFAIYAGLEPESFIELFPYWVIQEDITDLQLDEGIEEDKLCLISEALLLFSKDFYTIDELRAKPPPQGVDPTKLEKYLSEEDFFEVFHFKKEIFYQLPEWQQVNWKKKVDLY